MDRAGWHYPSGDIRVSDADRDQALSELRDAVQAGRLTGDEFDERADQALGARTGTELTALLADLPAERLVAPPALPERPDGTLPTRIVTGASAIGAAGFALAAAGSALIQSASLRQLELLREQMLSTAGAGRGSVMDLPYVIPHVTPAGLGPRFPPTLPPIPAYDWARVITPGVIAVLLTVLAVCLSVRLARADRA